MISVESDGFARIGYYLSLAGGLICVLSGVLLLRWLASLLYLGLLIVITALLQRMTYKTFASILTMLFSIVYLVFLWLVTSGLSMTPMVFNLQYVGLVGFLFGIIGGTISVISAARSR